jgi:predicted HAD superfamily Cof-like phosphohydrolase
MGRTIELTAKVRGGQVDLQPELDLGLPPQVRAHRSRPRTPKPDESFTKTVGEFHIAFNLPIATRPRARVSPELGNLRIELLREEFEEFRDAVQHEDVVAIADALGDIVYVAYGTAVTYGIDLDAVLREIHRANMSKLDPEGRPILRDDGKVLKSDQYRAPDIASVLLDQPPLFLD